MFGFDFIYSLLVELVVYFVEPSPLQFELPEDARQRVKKISVIRNLCQKVIFS